MTVKEFKKRFPKQAGMLEQLTAADGWPNTQQGVVDALVQMCEDNGEAIDAAIQAERPV